MALTDIIKGLAHKTVDFYEALRSEDMTPSQVDIESNVPLRNILDTNGIYFKIRIVGADGYVP